MTISINYSCSLDNSILKKVEKITNMVYKIVEIKPGLWIRIRIRIGSVFNWKRGSGSGSVFAIRIRIHASNFGSFQANRPSVWFSRQRRRHFKSAFFSGASQWMFSELVIWYCIIYMLNMWLLQRSYTAARWPISRLHNSKVFQRSKFFSLFSNIPCWL